jgi:hypothetical protein
MSVFVKWERKMSECLNLSSPEYRCCNNSPITTPIIYCRVLAFKSNIHIQYIRVGRLHCLGCYPFALIRSQSKTTNYVAHISNKSGNEEASIPHYCCQGLFLQEHFQHVYQDCAHSFPQLTKCCSMKQKSPPYIERQSSRL